MIFLPLHDGAPTQAQRSGLRGERRGSEMERMPAVRQAQQNGVCPDAQTP